MERKRESSTDSKERLSRKDSDRKWREMESAGVQDFPSN
jgi:hypothetical protein